MAIKTNFFDGNSVAAEDLIAPWASLLTDGTFSGVNVLAHTVANLSVDVQIGQAMKSGYYIRSDAVVNVSITSNTSGYSRIDLIVANVDTTNKIITFQAVQGIPSSSPVAPVAGALQLPLAQVLVGNNVSVLNQNVITDVRVTVMTNTSNPACRIHQANAQSLTSGTSTAISYDTVDFDTNNMSVTAGRITCQTAGKYHISAGVNVSASSKNIYLYQNSSIVMYSSGITVPVAKLDIDINLAIGDTIRFFINQTNGTSQSTIVVSNETYLSMFKIG